MRNERVMNQSYKMSNVSNTRVSEKSGQKVFMTKQKPNVHFLDDVEIVNQPSNTMFSPIDPIDETTLRNSKQGDT